MLKISAKQGLASHRLVAGLFSLFVMLGLVAAATPAAAVVIVAPNAQATTEGANNNSIPFSGTGDFDRYQQVYGSTHFGALSGPELITQIAFRPDGSQGAFGPHSFGNVEIKLSTTSAVPDLLSSTFANNVGADETTVYSGALSLSSAATGSGPLDFDVIITLQTPFLYNPTLGNLLFEFVNFSGDSFTTFALDADNTANNGVSRLFGETPTSTNGQLSSTGLVTQFTTQSNPVVAVPEPSTFLLFASGLGGLLAVRRRRSQTKAA